MKARAKKSTARRVEKFIGMPGPPERDEILIKIPPWVEILGQRWDVVVAPQWSDSVVGDCDAQRRLIRVRSDMSPWLSLETFMHELIHACLLAVGIDHEEQVVNSLAPVLLDTLRRAGARF